MHEIILQSSIWLKESSHWPITLVLFFATYLSSGMNPLKNFFNFLCPDPLEESLSLAAIAAQN